MGGYSSREAKVPLKSSSSVAEASVTSYGSFGDLDDEATGVDGRPDPKGGHSFFFRGCGGDDDYLGGLGGLSVHAAGRSIIGGASVGLSGRSLASVGVDAYVAPSGGSGDSAAASLSFSRSSVWNTLKPQVFSPEDLTAHEDKTWFKSVLLLQQNVPGVVLSVESLIDKIPVALDQLDTKAEEAFVHKLMLGLSVAVSQPFGDIKRQYSALRDLVLGCASTAEIKQFEGTSGTLLGAVGDMQNAIDKLTVEVSNASRLGSPVDLDNCFVEFATKAANAVRASADHAMAERLTLSDRIAALESRLDAQTSHADPVTVVFASALQGLSGAPIPLVTAPMPSPAAIANSAGEGALSDKTQPPDGC
jgi:hypothetical protein